MPTAAVSTCIEPRRCHWNFRPLDPLPFCIETAWMGRAVVLFYGSDTP
jgi:hypothetical protein